MISKHTQCSWSLTAVKIVKVYTCDTCHKRTQKSTTLSLASAVMRALAGCKKRKRFQCTGCRRSFGQKSSLNVHRRKHSKSKPHNCSQCNKRFITRSGLAMHRKGHNLKLVVDGENYSSTDASDQEGDDLQVVLEKDQSESTMDHKKAYPACTRLKQLLNLVKYQENTGSGVVKKQISTPKNVFERPKTRLFLSSKRKGKYSLLDKTSPVAVKTSPVSVKTSPVSVKTSPVVSILPEKKCSKVNIDTSLANYSTSASNVISYFVNVQMGDTSKSVLVTSEKHDTETSEVMSNSFDTKTEPESDFSMHSTGISIVDVQSMHDEDKSLAFKCKYCTESFESMEMLREHKKSHKTKRPIKVICPWTHCKKKLTSQKRLDSHLKRHNGETHYLCHKCGMQFTDCVFYHKHKIVCLQRCRKYECNVCGKELSGYSALQKHHRVHTGEKPSQCEICGARFNNNSHLTRHKRIHIRKGEMPPPEGYTPPTTVTLDSTCGMSDVSMPQIYTDYATCLEIGNEQVVAYCVEQENAYMASAQQTELLSATANVAKEMD